MNAPAHPLTPDPFDSATVALNAWRGRCLASFTRAEYAITEALVAIAEGDATVSLPHLVGQRYAALLTVLRQRGDAAATIEAIDAFQKHDELRSFLCHGVASVLLDRKGGWHAVFTLVMLLRQKVDRRTLLINVAEADTIATDLRRDQQRLEAKLRTITSPINTRGAKLQIVQAHTRSASADTEPG